MVNYIIVSETVILKRRDKFQTFWAIEKSDPSKRIRGGAYFEYNKKMALSPPKKKTGKKYPAACAECILKGRVERENDTLVFNLIFINLILFSL